MCREVTRYEMLIYRRKELRRHYQTRWFEFDLSPTWDLNAIWAMLSRGSCPQTANASSSASDGIWCSSCRGPRTERIMACPFFPCPLFNFLPFHGVAWFPLGFANLPHSVQRTRRAESWIKHWQVLPSTQGKLSTPLRQPPV